MDPQSLIERLFVKKVGALCYEFCLITYYILTYFGFDCDFVEVQVLRPGGSYDPLVEPPHAFNRVTLSGK